jgi:pilus assembly protein Flp/PilA
MKKRSFVSPCHVSRDCMTTRVPATDPPNFTDKVAAMTNLINGVRRFLANEDGPTAVEYAVLVGLITVALVSIISGLHSAISTTFSTVSGILSSANSS